MFHRNICIEGIKKPQRISVGYYVVEVDGKDVIDTNANPKVFCYFPTSEQFNQKRIMHAPFLLTASRSELREDMLNDFLIQELAKLSADSLVYLRDIGLKYRNVLIDNNLFELITLPRYYRDGSSVYDIWASEYQRVIKENDLLLTKAGKYITIADAIIARPAKLREVINDKQLTTLQRSSKPLYFVCSQIKTNSNEWEYLTRTLGISVFDYNKFAQIVSADFMSGQSDAWLHRFYKHLNDPNIWSLFKESPIIRTNKGEFVAPYQDGMLNVFRASANVASDKHIVDPSLIKKRTTKELFEKLGIRELKPIDQIEAIRIKYQKNIDISKEELFEDTYYICNLYLHSKKTTQDSIVNKLANRFVVSSLTEGNETLARIGETYNKNTSLDNYFRRNIESYVMLNNEFYERLFQEFDKERVLELFFQLGLKQTPIITQKQKLISELPEHTRREILCNPASNVYEIEEFEMQGLEYVLNNNLNKELSLEIWKWIGDALKNKKRWDELVYSYFYYTNKKGKTKSSMLFMLTSARWIYIEGKPKNTPNKFTRQQMREAGYANNEELFDLLGVKRTWEDSASIPDEVKELARLGEMLRDCSEDELHKVDGFVKNLKLQSPPVDNEEWWLYLNAEEQDDSNVDTSSTTSISSDTRAKESKQIVFPAFDNIEWVAQHIDPKKSHPAYSLAKSSKGKSPDYEKDSKNHKVLGDRGEYIVYCAEIERIQKELGVSRNAADQYIDWRSRKGDDGCGYDIKSVNANHTPRYIEVKATQKTVGDTVFYYTENELQQAKKYGDNYCIYMVYDILTPSPKIWNMGNPFKEDGVLELQPIKYRVKVKTTRK